MQEAMDKAISEKIQFKIESDERREKVEILSEEKESLRLKIQDVEDENKKFKKQMKNMQH